MEEGWFQKQRISFVERKCQLILPIAVLCFTHEINVYLFSRTCYIPSPSQPYLFSSESKLVKITLNEATHVKIS